MAPHECKLPLRTQRRPAPQDFSGVWRIGNAARSPPGADVVNRADSKAERSADFRASSATYGEGRTTGFPGEGSSGPASRRNVWRFLAQPHAEREIDVDPAAGFLE
jgi:hypothetical protein